MKSYFIGGAFFYLKRLFANSTAKHTVLQERAPFVGMVRAVRAIMPPCLHILFVSMINVFFL